MTEIEDYMLPDLHTLPPQNLLIQLIRSSGIKRLRFSNTIYNSGPGDLDLRALPISIPGAVRVTQYVPGADGNILLHEAGVFDFHVEHGHWHWVGFGLYEVLTVTDTGVPGEVVAQSDKVGYCLIDVDPMPGDPLAGDPFYTSCVWDRQGISAGWTDTYESHVGGQYVDITHLPDGLYVLRSTVDPDNIILEVDDTNNSARMFFYLYGENLLVVGERYFAPRQRPTPE